MEKWQLDSEAECSVLKPARANYARSYGNSIAEDDMLMDEGEEEASYSASRYSPDLRSSPSPDRGWDRFSDTPGRVDIYSDYLCEEGEELGEESDSGTGWVTASPGPRNEYDNATDAGGASAYEDFIRGAMQYDDKSPSSNVIRKSPPQKITLLRVSPSRNSFHRSHASSVSASVMYPSTKERPRVESSQARSVASVQSVPSEASSPSSPSAYIVQSNSKISELRERLKYSMLASPSPSHSDRGDFGRGVLSMSVRSDLTRATNAGGDGGVSTKVSYSPNL